MPGIVGIIGRGPSEAYQRQIKTMLATMMHEQSYVAGTHAAPELGVYAGWTAHDEREAAARITFDDRGDRALIFAGECGGRALLKGYDRDGDEFVTAIDGSFAGMLIDPLQGRAVLFNDRFGAERIYYHETSSALYFASEAKALLSVLPQLRAFDDDGVVQFLIYGAALPDRTLFRDLRVMQPGSIWAFDGHLPLARRLYFDPNAWRELPELTAEQFREELSDALQSAVKRCVSSQASIGISITGGLDTRMVMALLPETTRTPICYTFVGVEGETLDARLGKRVAQACGLEHHLLRVGPDFLADYGHYVDRTVFVTDGYAGALGAHEIYLNAKAKQLAPVRMTGNFGSEILRGMSTFKPINLAEDVLDPCLQSRLASLRERDVAPETHPVIFAAFHEIPSIHYGIPAAARSQVTLRTPFMSNAVVQLAVRAPAAERNSPSACAELVARHNHVLGRIPTDRGVLPDSKLRPRPWSRLLSEVTFKLDYLHKEGLAPPLTKLEPGFRLLSHTRLLGVHKFLPYRNWFKQELAGYVASVLSDPSTRRMSWWNGATLDRILPDHQKGRRNYLREIHAILTLEAVQRRLIGSTVRDPA
ncbi:MAG TPA: asparagine synthase-related protein [Gammaproteobacteria bacterium]